MKRDDVDMTAPVDERFCHRFIPGLSKVPPAKAGIVVERGWLTSRQSPPRERTYGITIVTGRDQSPGGGRHSVRRSVSELEVRAARVDIAKQLKVEAWRELREHFIANELV